MRYIYKIFNIIFYYLAIIFECIANGLGVIADWFGDKERNCYWKKKLND